MGSCGTFNRILRRPDATAQDGKSFTFKRAPLMPQDIYVRSDLLNATHAHVRIAVREATTICIHVCMRHPLA